MYSISEVAIETGFTAHTLRYYEKAGILPSPARSGGRREYTAGELRLLKFMKVLKQTGMSLEDIREFLQDGCLLESVGRDDRKEQKIMKRTQILEKHLVLLERQKEELETLIGLTKEKLDTYHEMIEEVRHEK